MKTSSHERVYRAPPPASQPLLENARDVSAHVKAPQPLHLPGGWRGGRWDGRVRRDAAASYVAGCFKLIKGIPNYRTNQRTDLDQWDIHRPNCLRQSSCQITPLDIPQALTRRGRGATWSGVIARPTTRNSSHKVQHLPAPLYRHFCFQEIDVAWRHPVSRQTS